MTTDALLVTTSDGALYLLAALTLTYVAAELGLLLRLAILPIANRDRRAVSIPRASCHNFRLLCLCVWPL